MIDWFTMAIREDPDVVAVALVGSIAAGEADEWSDVDLDVLVADDALGRAWSKSTALIQRSGEVAAIVHVWDIVPYSVIAFYNGQPRIHLSYHAASDYPDADADRTVWVVTQQEESPGTEDSTSNALAPPELEGPSSPERFVFWANRLLVGLHRSDRAQIAESRLYMLEIALHARARLRDSEFFGLRKIDLYLSDEEAAWCDGYLGAVEFAHVASYASAVAASYEKDARTLHRGRNDASLWSYLNRAVQDIEVFANRQEFDESHLSDGPLP